MKTFYKVIGRYPDNGIVEARIEKIASENLPENSFISTPRSDVYCDYFETLEEAFDFYTDTLNS